MSMLPGTKVGEKKKKEKEAQPSLNRPGRRSARSRPILWLLLILIILITLYGLWLGYQLVRFRPHQLPPESETPGLASVPPYEIRGVYHIHSRYSDGRSSVAKIARVARRQGLDFLILTDHGHPNLRCLESQGWREGVLVLAGSELSVSRGHLVALDITAPRRPFSQNAEQAAREIRANGGFSIIAHPFSKVRWSWGDAVEYAGLEIIDMDTMFKKNFLPALPYLPALLLRPRFYLLKTLERPAQSLRKWDELNHSHALFGYFSADAHLLYSVLLAGFHLHILLDSPLAQDFAEARAQVFGALRQGRFYSALNAAGEARGFRFWAEAEQSRWPMGSFIPASTIPGLRILTHLPFTRVTETHLIHDGRIRRRSTGPGLSFAVDEPGTYRVEVYLLKKQSPLAPDVPWIVSNPIFIGKEPK